MTVIYFFCFLVAPVRGPSTLAVFLPRNTAIITLAGFSPVCTLRFTPALLRLSTVLLRILHSPCSGDVVTTLDIAAPTNLSEPPAARTHRWSSTIYAVEPALAGEVTTRVDV
jgi:hypothetical protein